MAVRVFEIIFDQPGRLGIIFTGTPGEYEGLIVEHVNDTSPCCGLIMEGDRLLQIGEHHLVSDTLPDDEALALVRAVLATKPAELIMVVLRQEGLLTITDGDTDDAQACVFEYDAVTYADGLSVPVSAMQAICDTPHNAAVGRDDAASHGDAGGRAHTPSSAGDDLATARSVDGAGSDSGVDGGLSDAPSAVAHTVASAATRGRQHLDAILIERMRLGADTGRVPWRLGRDDTAPDTASSCNDSGYERSVPPSPAHAPTRRAAVDAPSRLRVGAPAPPPLRRGETVPALPVAGAAHTGVVRSTGSQPLLRFVGQRSAMPGDDAFAETSFGDESIADVIAALRQPNEAWSEHTTPQPATHEHTTPQPATHATPPARSTGKAAAGSTLARHAGATVGAGLAAAARDTHPSWSAPRRSASDWLLGGDEADTLGWEHACDPAAPQYSPPAVRAPSHITVFDDDDDGDEGLATPPPPPRRQASLARRVGAAVTAPRMTDEPPRRRFSRPGAGKAAAAVGGAAGGAGGTAGVQGAWGAQPRSPLEENVFI